MLLVTVIVVEVAAIVAVDIVVAVVSDVVVDAVAASRQFSSLPFKVGVRKFQLCWTFFFSGGNRLNQETVNICAKVP